MSSSRTGGAKRGVSEYLLDASALLALVNDEVGAERVATAIGEAAISAVNLTEVVGKLHERGMPIDAAREAVSGLGLRVIPFAESLVYATAGLRVATRKLGLSLADRACLATAKALALPVLTTDRSWLKVKASVKVICIR